VLRRPIEITRVIGNLKSTCTISAITVQEERKCERCAVSEYRGQSNFVTVGRLAAIWFRCADRIKPNYRDAASVTPSRNQFTVKAASKKYRWPAGFVAVMRTGPEDKFGTVALSVMPSTKVVVTEDVPNKTLAPL